MWLLYLFLIFVVKSSTTTGQADAVHVYTPLEGDSSDWVTSEQSPAVTVDLPTNLSEVKRRLSEYRNNFGGGYWGPALLYGGLSPRTVYKYDMSGKVQTPLDTSSRNVIDEPILPVTNEDTFGQGDRGDNMFQAPFMGLAKRHGRLQGFRDRKASNFVSSDEDGLPSRLQSGGGRSGLKLKGSPNVLFKMRMFG